MSGKRMDAGGGAETSSPASGNGEAAPHEQYISGLSDSEKSRMLAQALQESAAANPQHWQYLFTLQRASDNVRDALLEVKDMLAGARGDFEAVGGRQEELTEQVRALFTERDELITKLVAPVTELTAAIVAMTKGQHVSEATDVVIKDADETFRGFAASAGKVIRGAANERRVLLWVIAAASVTSLVLSLLALLRR